MDQQHQAHARQSLRKQLLMIDLAEVHQGFSLSNCIQRGRPDSHLMIVEVWAKSMRVHMFRGGLQR